MSLVPSFVPRTAGRRTAMLARVASACCASALLLLLFCPTAHGQVQQVDTEEYARFLGREMTETEIISFIAARQPEGNSEVLQLLNDANFTFLDILVQSDVSDLTNMERALKLYQEALRKVRARKDSDGQQDVRDVRKLISRTERAIASYRTAVAEATLDLSRGRMIYMVFGLAAGDLKARLYKYYRVEVRQVGDCQAPYEVMARAIGYNSVSVPAMKARYGPDFQNVLSGRAR